MKRCVICLVLPLMMLACKNGGSGDKAKLLLGSWHAIKLDNPEMDSFFINSQAYIDTIGKNNSPELNVSLYGVANMDSMRKILQLQYDSAKNMQADAVKNTIFNFRNDSIAVLSFSGNSDSSRWKIVTADSLVLTEINPPSGAPDHIAMQILSLTDKELKLRFMESGAFSTVTFSH